MQILARPATARRIRAARRTAATPTGMARSDLASKATGGVARTLAGAIVSVVDVFSPGPSRRTR